MDILYPTYSRALCLPLAVIAPCGLGCTGPWDARCPLSGQSSTLSSGHTLPLPKSAGHSRGVTGIPLPTSPGPAPHDISLSPSLKPLSFLWLHLSLKPSVFCRVPYFTRTPSPSPALARRPGLSSSPGAALVHRTLSFWGGGGG